MKKRLFTVIFTAMLSHAAVAADGGLEVKTNAFDDGGKIPFRYAFCVPYAKTHSIDGTNFNPKISWSKGPDGTKSYAVIVHDTDVPTVFDDANKEDVSISKDLERKDFYHWVLVDIPADRTFIKEKEDSKKLVKSGKKPGKKPYGLSGKNDFGSFMGGEFGGYDGPCPPWNDELVHHYHFTVYALDVETLGLPEDGKFGGKEALEAMEGHILAKGTVSGTYTQNQNLLKK